MTLKYAAQWSVQGILLPYFPLKSLTCECSDDESESKKRNDSNLETEKYNSRIKQALQKTFLDSIWDISVSEKAQLEGECERYEYDGFTGPHLSMNLDDRTIEAIFTMNLGTDASVNGGRIDSSIVRPYTSFFCEIKSHAPLYVGDASSYMSRIAGMSKKWVDKIAQDCTGKRPESNISFYISCLGLDTGKKEFWPGMCQHGEVKEGGIMQNEFLGFKRYLEKLAKNDNDVEQLFKELSGIHGKMEIDRKMIYVLRGEDYFFSHLGLTGNELKWSGVSTVPSAEGISEFLGSILVKNWVFIDSRESK